MIENKMSFIAELKEQEKIKKDIFQKVGSKKIVELITKAPIVAAFAYDNNKADEGVLISACKLIVKSVDSMMEREGRFVSCNYIIIDDSDIKKPFVAVYLFGEGIEDGEDASDILESGIRNLEEYDGPESKIVDWIWNYCTWNEMLEDFPDAKVFSKIH